MNMKQIGMKMSLLMGVSLSLCLSFTGNLFSGHFTIPGFLTSFLISFLISLIIGFFVPMKKVGDVVTEKAGLTPHTLPARALESLVSDCIYTPFITLCMTTLARYTAIRHGQEMPPLLLMFLKSLLISMIIGYVLIFLVSPVFLKIAMKNSGSQE